MVVSLHQVKLKRKTARAIYIVLIVIAILGITRFTGLWTFGRMAGSSMSPNLKTGEYFFAVKAGDLERQQIVIYRMDNTPDISVGRIIGTPGDTIIIKKGLVFLNRVFVDDTLNLDYTYKASISELGKVPEMRKLQESGHIFIDKDSFSVNLSPSAIDKNKIIARRVSFSTEFDATKFNLKPNSRWTIDDFGPVIVPSDKYFILCDNRGNSFDSRHRGFILGKNIKFRKF